MEDCSISHIAEMSERELMRWYVVVLLRQEQGRYRVESSFYWDITRALERCKRACDHALFDDQQVGAHLHCAVCDQCPSLGAHGWRRVRRRDPA